MLTADHVEARIKDGELVLRKLDARARKDALALAAAYLDDARAHVGRTREDLDAAWEDHDAGSRVRLAAGLRKLVADVCTFDERTELDPVVLRRALFGRAAAWRRERGALDRDVVLAETAASLGVAAEAIETLLFADRRGEHVLRAAPPPSTTAEAIVDAYELGRAQAVLLRAVRVTCDVSAASPGVLRAFFAKLKFHQLLFTLERRGSGYRIALDGPASMFDAGTRYGLTLALVLPALRDLDAWNLEAEVRWGRARTPAVFRLAGAAGARAGANHGAALISSDVNALLEGITKAKSGWTASVSDAILDVPGYGVVVPDLVLRRDGDEIAAPIYVEVLGFWSRDAVWRRVELAERGLGADVVFCVPLRLRVSEEVVSETAHAALYVYKTRMNARALLERADRLYAARSCTSSSPEPRAGSAKPSPAST